ncbi:MAG TPA: isochorismatase family cysteine hydrolase [Opitutaceae bacterium]|nr:isochorismatase family cysteine hydrolase [Opitutaceae bacterium]
MTAKRASASPRRSSSPSKTSSPPAARADGKRRRRQPPSTALLIVDVQHAFPIPARLVEKIRHYSESFSRRVFTRFVNPKGSFFRTQLKMTCCPPGSKETELRLVPARGDLILDKATYGLRPGQIEQLRRAGIRRVILCGVETDACVLGIMFSLFDAGIKAEIQSDLCWSSTGLHRHALKIIATQFKP